MYNFNDDIKKIEKGSYHFKMQSIYNFNTGKEEAADYHLSQDEATVYRLRYSLASGKKKYGCPICKNKVIIKKSVKGRFFFSHTRLKAGESCFLVDQSNYETRRIQEYNYHKESQEHIELKEDVSHFLKQTKGIDSNSVKVEKVIKGQAVPHTWKKPDIQFKTTKGKRFVVEIQLANTWLSDIVKRDLFYEKEGITILWIFNKFEPYGFEKTTKKDIYYNNPFMNVFVFDELAKQQSLKTGELHLNCYYKAPEKTGRDSFTVSWHDKIVSISQIKIYKQSGKPYFFDSFDLIDKAEEWKQEQIELIKEEQRQERLRVQRQKEKDKYDLKLMFEYNAKTIEQDKPVEDMVKIPIGKVQKYQREVLHVPTQKKHNVLWLQKNRQGVWYYTEEDLWLFSKDCK